MSAHTAPRHVAAIHVLKSKLQLSDDDYRALLRSLTGCTSSKDLSLAQQAAVRQHLQRLAERMGVAGVGPRAGKTARQSPRPLGTDAFAQRVADTPALQRKVWALWHQLGRDGLVRDTSAAALDAWVQRQTMARSGAATALRFTTVAQQHALIEALKDWQRRAAPQAVVTPAAAQTQTVTQTVVTVPAP